MRPLPKPRATRHSGDNNAAHSATTRAANTHLPTSRFAQPVHKQGRERGLFSLERTNRSCTTLISTSDHTRKHTTQR